LQTGENPNALRSDSDATPAPSKKQILQAAPQKPWQPGNLHPHLSWTHYRILIRVEAEAVRASYEIEAISAAALTEMADALTPAFACVCRLMRWFRGRKRAPFPPPSQARRRLSRGERQRGGLYQSSQHEDSPIVPWRLSNGCQSLGRRRQHEA
jgi:hypothetical protein